MSYTSPDERVEEPLAELLSAVESFRQVMWARIRGSETWSESHRQECKETLDKLNDLEVDLRGKF